MNYVIVKRTFSDSGEAVIYAQEHLCVALAAATSGVVRYGDEYWVFELAEVGAA